VFLDSRLTDIDPELYEQLRMREQSA